MGTQTQSPKPFLGIYVTLQQDFGHFPGDYPEGSLGASLKDGGWTFHDFERDGQRGVYQPSIYPDVYQSLRSTNVGDGGLAADVSSEWRTNQRYRLASHWSAQGLSFRGKPKESWKLIAVQSGASPLRPSSRSRVNTSSPAQSTDKQTPSSAHAAHSRPPISACTARSPLKPSPTMSPAHTNMTPATMFGATTPTRHRATALSGNNTTTSALSESTCPALSRNQVHTNGAHPSQRSRWLAISVKHSPAAFRFQQNPKLRKALPQIFADQLMNHTNS
ncbi:hypothetical protein P389DRAFT_211069 [Cystobasidium minutum MCA 4210]|uniref:uncharacterized protein n=1 Tax=Cystobasidium minutum MCA 4210 TaxID=1397322 RepID=UPI0034CEBAA2|eukprot:jgi/Rhomi1/211069/estExt_Genemark1.C_4_t20193